MAILSQVRSPACRRPAEPPSLRGTGSGVRSVAHRKLRGSGPTQLAYVFGGKSLGLGERGVYAASACEPSPDWESSSALASRTVKRRKRRAPPLNTYQLVRRCLSTLALLAAFS